MVWKIIATRSERVYIHNAYDTYSHSKNDFPSTLYAPSEPHQKFKYVKINWSADKQKILGFGVYFYAVEQRNNFTCNYQAYEVRSLKKLQFGGPYPGAEYNAGFPKDEYALHFGTEKAVYGEYLWPVFTQSLLAVLFLLDKELKGSFDYFRSELKLFNCDWQLGMQINTESLASGLEKDLEAEDYYSGQPSTFYKYSKSEVKNNSSYSEAIIKLYAPFICFRLYALYQEINALFLDGNSRLRADEEAIFAQKFGFYKNKFTELYNLIDNTHEDYAVLSSYMQAMLSTTVPQDETDEERAQRLDASLVLATRQRDLVRMFEFFNLKAGLSPLTNDEEVAEDLANFNKQAFDLSTQNDLLPSFMSMLATHVKKQVADFQVREMPEQAERKLSFF